MFQMLWLETCAPCHACGDFTPDDMLHSDLQKAALPHGVPTPSDDPRHDDAQTPYPWLRYFFPRVCLGSAPRSV